MNEVAKEAGFFQDILSKIKDFFTQSNIEAWYREIRKSTIGFALLCFGAGFVVGFLFKKYFKILFFCIIIAVGVVAFLHYQQIIVVDWEALKNMAGITPVPGQVQTMFETAWQWVQIHAVATIAIVLGFVFGYRLG